MTNFMNCYPKNNTHTWTAYIECICTKRRQFSAHFRNAPWFSAFHTSGDCSWDDMSTLSTYLQNVSIKSQFMDTLSQRVHNVDTFSAERYEEVAKADQLEAIIKKNLKIGYRE